MHRIHLSTCNKTLVTLTVGAVRSIWIPTVQGEHSRPPQPTGTRPPGPGHAETNAIKRPEQEHCLALPPHLYFFGGGGACYNVHHGLGTVPPFPTPKPRAHFGDPSDSETQCRSRLAPPSEEEEEEEETCTPYRDLGSVHKSHQQKGGGGGKQSCSASVEMCKGKEKKTPPSFQWRPFSAVYRWTIPFLRCCLPLFTVTFHRRKRIPPPTHLPASLPLQGRQR